MKYCPILSFQADRYGEIGCREDRCAFADEAGDCLVQQALLCYVSAERTRVAEETERIRRETQLAHSYWAMKKDGTRSPIQFLQDGDMTPYTPPANTKLDPEYPKNPQFLVLLLDPNAEGHHYIKHHSIFKQKLPQKGSNKVDFW